MENDKGIDCHHCKIWVHHKCIELSDSDFKYLQTNKDSWYCIKCIPTFSPFRTKKINQANINSKYQSKPKLSLLNLINQSNNYSNEQNNENNQNMLYMSLTCFQFMFSSILIPGYLTLLEEWSLCLLS